MEKNKCGPNSNWDNKNISEQRDQTWWDEEQKKKKKEVSISSVPIVSNGFVFNLVSDSSAAQ